VTILTMGVGGRRDGRDGRTVMANGGGWWSSVLGGLDSGGVELRAAQDEVVSDRTKGAFYRLAWRAEVLGERWLPASMDFYFSRWFREEGK
jgi:hypothetical protein